MSVFQRAVSVAVCLAGFCIGGFIGFMGPALIAQLIGYGTGSYEDVMFIWLFSVPGMAFVTPLTFWYAWKKYILNRSSSNEP